MAFRLGNHVIDEILYGVAQNFNDELLFTLDQLSSASIEISAESTEIQDKKGNVLRTQYRSKSGNFNSTNAFLHPAVMNAASGSDIVVASETKPIQMPKIISVPAGTTIDASDALTGTIHVIGLYGNGANDVALTQGTTAVVGQTFALVDGKLTVPAAGTNAPVTYIVRYERNVESGIKLSNLSNKFPNTIHMTFLCSYMDPCSDELKPCYVYIGSFMPDPSITINLDSENQELDFNGIIQTDYCSADKVLYVIYYPDEDLTVIGEDTDDEDEGGDDVIIVGHTVTFNSNGGSEVAAATVLDGDAVARPTDPTKAGSTFDGWYTDDETFANAYDFSTPVTADLTLFAKWQ